MSKSDVADLVRRLIQDANFMEFIGRHHEAEYEHLRPEPPKEKSSWHDMARTLREAADALAPHSEKVTRFEVIDYSGRVYSRWNSRIEMAYQDDGRTLKVFVEPLPAPPAENA